MGQRVLGIDLGTHTVKLAKVEVGFQTAKLIELQTVGVSLGTGGSLESSVQALAGLGGLQEHFDAVSVGLPGDRLLLRLLDVPFVDAKRVGAVVGNELADDLPWEMEDVVFDHALLPTVSGKVLAAVARSAEVRALLASLAELGLEPRALPASPLGYAALVRRIEPEAPVLVVDLGHTRTNVCMVQGGRALLGRTISRGGHQITEAFRQTFQVSYAEAEALKEQQAMVLSPGLTAGPAEQQVIEVTTQAVLPLLRDLRLTAGLFAARLGVKPERLLLCGGTSLLRGLDAALGAELGTPAQRLDLLEVKDFQPVELPAEGQAVGSLSLGLALEQGGRQGIDLRQGEFAFHQDGSIFKDKMLTIVISLATVLIFAALNAIMSLRALRIEETALSLQLKRATQTVFGEAVKNPKLVSRKVKLGSKAVSSGIPERTAFDVLSYLSSNIPGGSKVKLDITRLDIKQGKTFLTGTADSRSAVDDIVKGLEKDRCFSKIATGTISDVSDGKKQFSLTINTECF